jgi:hypothetical protein
VTVPVPRGWRDMESCTYQPPQPSHRRRLTRRAERGIALQRRAKCGPDPGTTSPGWGCRCDFRGGEQTNVAAWLHSTSSARWPLWRQRAVRRRSRNPQPSQDNSTGAAGNLDRCVGSGQQRVDGDARGKFPQDQAVRGHVENGEVGDDPVDQGPFVAPVRGASPRSRRRGRTLGRGDEEARTCRNRLRCRASSSAMG